MNPESIRKVAKIKALFADEASNTDQIELNSIYQTNKDIWDLELKTEVTKIQEWKHGKEMVRGFQASHLGIVYNIVQTHIAEFAPAIVPALFRKAPFIYPNETYPRWDSIAPLDSESNWKLNDRVEWAGKEWESKQNDNIYEPGAVASSIWEEIGAVIDPPVDPPSNPCEGVAAWSGSQHWSTYTVGDKRTDGGKLYELHTQAWSQSYAPSSAYGYLGWTFLNDCV